MIYRDNGDSWEIQDPMDYFREGPNDPYYSIEGYYEWPTVVSNAEYAYSGRWGGGSCFNRFWKLSKESVVGEIFDKAIVTFLAIPGGESFPVVSIDGGIRWFQKTTFINFAKENGFKKANEATKALAAKINSSDIED